MLIAKETHELFIECWHISSKYKNYFISVEHFYLAYNRLKFDRNIDLKLTLSDIKILINGIKNHSIDKNDDENYLLTKEMERVLKASKLHAFILDSKEIFPKHIYLSTIYEIQKNKTKYLEYLKKEGIRLGLFKRVLIKLYWNKIFRFIRIINFLNVFYYLNNVLLSIKLNFKNSLL